MYRRTFLAGGGVALAAAAGRSSAFAQSRRRAVDFRYAPRLRQATFCFPDDPHKSLVGESGDLRYGFDRRRRVNYFPEVVQFSVRGMEADRVASQRLEAPGVPIVHTRIDRPEAFLELTTFATRRDGEGRVDNVILEVLPREKRLLHAAPVVLLKTRRTAVARDAAIHLDRESEPPFLVASCPLRAGDTGDGYLLSAPELPAEVHRPLVCFFRFPQEGQSLAALEAGLRAPDALLAEARVWWRNWSPFEGEVAWQLPGAHHSFLTACARNILQARERIDGKLTFQVGPTTYRGLWVVDGNFLLESARYLGYDREAQQGLETTWSMQQPDGSVVAAVQTAHWKDTGIAMFSMVRQAELSQDWSYFRKMQPELLRAVRFLASIRDKARAEGSANGGYGLLARGFGDGGIGGGVRDEFTNTVWALAGLKAVTGAAERLGLSGFEEAASFYRELRASFFSAARRQMRRHPAGFEYLPMLLKEDPGWNDPDEWKRPRPQTGQWALAHSIFPGLVFDHGDPVVKGYIALMQSSTEEEVPIETGWLPHDGLWNYDAAFASHVYLWAGERDWALDTFTGFLNHASPLYCWREEQPLHGALVGSYVGDMPHNWASAECVLFLRHMLALEDGANLRLLAGIGAPELAAGDPYRIEASPTRFGRVSLRLEPRDRMRGWRLQFKRGPGPQPAAVQLPATLGTHEFSKATAPAKRQGRQIQLDPESSSWEVTWN